MPPAHPTDRIIIEDLHVECIIGIQPEERVVPQRLSVCAELCLDLARAAKSERLVESVDYRLVTHQLVFLLKFGEFHLLETAAHVLCQSLLLPPESGEGRSAIESVRLSLKKPGALDNRATPSLVIHRDQSELRGVVEHKPFGTVDVIHETAEAGFYRLNIAPGRSIESHVHHRMREAEFVLSSGLLCQNQPAAPGSIRLWPNQMTHRYDNPTERVQSLLCVDRPPFVETDEVPSAGALGALSAVTAWEL